MAVINENHQRCKDDIFNNIVPWIELKSYKSLRGHSNPEIECILTWLQKENYCTLAYGNNDQLKVNLI